MANLIVMQGEMERYIANYTPRKCEKTISEQEIKVPLILKQDIEKIIAAFQSDISPLKERRIHQLVLNDASLSKFNNPYFIEAITSFLDSDQGKKYL